MPCLFQFAILKPMQKQTNFLNPLIPVENQVSVTQAKENLTAVVAARTKLLRSALLSYLYAIPSVQVIAQAEKRETALNLLSVFRPDVLVLDADLGGDALSEMVSGLRRDYPDLNCIVLFNTIREQRCSLQAGASHAFPKDFLGEGFRSAVLSEKGGGG